MSAGDELVERLNAALPSRVVEGVIFAELRQQRQGLSKILVQRSDWDEREAALIEFRGPW